MGKKRIRLRRYPWLKEHYRKKYDRGECRACKKPRRPDSVFCQEHLTIKKVSEARRRFAQLKKGLCSIGGCGKPLDGTHDKCKHHHEHYAAYFRERARKA